MGTLWSAFWIYLNYYLSAIDFLKKKFYLQTAVETPVAGSCLLPKDPLLLAASCFVWSQLWILPLVLFYVLWELWNGTVTTTLGYSEDNDCSALLNPKALHHSSIIRRMFWSWTKSKSFYKCHGTLVFLCVWRDASYDFNLREVEALTNRVLWWLLINLSHKIDNVLIGQNRNNKIELRLLTTTLRFQFFSAGETAQGKWIIALPDCYVRVSRPKMI